MSESNAPMDAYKEHPHTQYGFIVGFVPNFALLTYTTVKLIQSLKRSENEAKYGQNRTVVFSLIFIALLSRCVFEADQIYAHFLTSHQSDLTKNIFAQLDNLPILLIITLASFFSNYWHKHYIKFEGEGATEGKFYPYFLTGINVALYAAFITLAVLFVISPSKHLQAGIFGAFALGLIIMAIVLRITGKRLYQRATTFVSYTGRNIKSSKGFQRSYSTLLFCCSIKIVQHCLALFCMLNNSSNFAFEKIVNAGSTAYYLYEIGFIFVFYTIGETLFFLFLIILLDINATKCEELLNKKVAMTSLQGPLLSSDRSHSLIEQP